MAKKLTYDTATYNDGDVYAIGKHQSATYTSTDLFNMQKVP